MKLSEEKISHLAHQIKKEFTQHHCGEILQENKTLNIAKDIITKFLNIEDQADEKTRQIINSYSKDVPEGSREWDILYQKHFEQEFQKLWA